MNNRMKEVRKALNMTQANFGKRIGIKQAYVAMLETGKTEITPVLTKSICNEYGVNEEWFLTGKGEMFLFDLEEDEVVKLYNHIKDKIPRRMLKQVKQFLEKANTFTEEDWEALSRLADKILGD